MRSTLRRAAPLALAFMLAAAGARGQGQGAAGAPGAPEKCELPPYVTGAIAGAQGADLVVLGPPSDRSSDPFDAGPTRFVGYRATATATVGPAALARLRAALAGRRLACTPGPPSPPSGVPLYAVGFELSGHGGLRVVVRPSDGHVDLELPNGRPYERWLTAKGAAAWRRVLDALADQLGLTRPQLEQQLAQEAGPLRPAPAHADTTAGAADTASAAVTPRGQR